MIVLDLLCYATFCYVGFGSITLRVESLPKGMRSRLDGLGQGLGSFPKGIHSLFFWGLIVPEGDAITTRWPGAGATVVPEGDALAITLGFVVPEALLRSCWVWDVPERDSFIIRLGFLSAKRYCDHVGFGMFPKGSHS